MNKKFITILLLLIAVIIIINAIFLNASKKQVIVDTSEYIQGGKFKIRVDDYYEGDYEWSDSIDYDFDKYLSIDLNVENVTEEEQTFMALMHFTLDDGNYKKKNIVIDENGKKFSKELYPGENFDITLTFPVDEANEYILYYSESLKEEDESSVGFKLDGVDLKKKEVDKTVDHFTPGSEEEEKEVEKKE